jgi:hypothetical protein
MGLYSAVTKLTVIKFGGRTIHKRRTVPAGAYSSAYTADHGEFIGDYFGTITGNRIEGMVYLQSKSTVLLRTTAAMISASSPFSSLKIL